MYQRAPCVLAGYAPSPLASADDDASSSLLVASVSAGCVALALVVALLLLLRQKKARAGRAAPARTSRGTGTDAATSSQLAVPTEVTIELHDLKAGMVPR